MAAAAVSKPKLVPHSVTGLDKLRGSFRTYSEIKFSLDFPDLHVQACSSSLASTTDLFESEEVRTA